MCWRRGDGYANVWMYGVSKILCIDELILTAQIIDK